ncbi:hypothetical protein [Aureimonas ureilytica]|uniref:hypothetical protein n=1 Tax=Aureimonas ureilytica TaxID=401562 RepID=UPI000B1DADF2|nr:hypothetical protein [Aureimonas ureilytica]
MPKATFAKDFDYRVPGKPSIVAYPAGWSGNVPKSHYDAAVEAGALEAKPEADADE